MSDKAEEERPVAEEEEEEKPVAEPEEEEKPVAEPEEEEKPAAEPEEEKPAEEETKDTPETPLLEEPAAAEAAAGTGEAEVVVEVKEKEEEEEEVDLDAEIAASKERMRKEFMEEERVGFYQVWVKPHLTKGPIANATAFTLMLLGIILAAAIGDEVDGKYPRNRWTFFILNTGLFAFSGGFTNWVAIEMLFTKVPGLIGSGVIPNRFKEIRETVKKVVMLTFFDRAFLQKYLSQKAGQLIGSFSVEDKMRALLESPVIDRVIDEKLEELGQRPEGMWLAMMGINIVSLKPMIKPFVLSMGADMAPMLMELINPKSLVNVDRIRNEVDKLMEEKLKELTPQLVNAMMKKVIAEHLGWLVVWGTLMGGFIGLVAEFVTFASE